MRSLLFIVLTSCSAALGAEFYASPTASGTGTGTLSNPWTLTVALGDNNSPTSSNTVVAAGDTIWLMGGTYLGPYAADLRPTSRNTARALRAITLRAR